jgi:hypothetical protein
MKSLITRLFVILALIGFASPQFADAKTGKHHKGAHKNTHAKGKGKGKGKKKKKKKKAHARKAPAETIEAPVENNTQPASTQ